MVISYLLNLLFIHSIKFELVFLELADVSLVVSEFNVLDLVPSFSVSSA